MKYQVYKFDFQGAVHFGKSLLEDGEYTFCADTLFSALCHEALKDSKEKMDELFRNVKEGKLLFSDAFPYISDNLYLPKPMLHIENTETQGDSKVKKAYKKLKYVPVKEFNSYLKGTFDIENCDNLKGLGKFDMRVSAAVRGENETLPYRVGTFFFEENSGLYIILGYESDEVLEFAEELLDSLSYSGIGGKRTMGMGRFILKRSKTEDELLSRLGKTGERYMTLSVSLPTDNELETVLENAEYSLVRRSGFVLSDTYFEQQLRKRDLYVLKSGSCVNTIFKGDVYDVSDKPGKHPVYKYAKPIFLEVDA